MAELKQVKAALTMISRIRRNLGEAREQAGYIRGLLEAEKEQVLCSIKNAEKKND